MSILLRSISPELQKKIKIAAAISGKTMEVFLEDIMEKHLQGMPLDTEEMLKQILEKDQSEGEIE